MTSKRQNLIGIKQAIRFEWMEKTANLLLAGLDSKTIRIELHEFLAERKGDGSEGPRSEQTRTFVVNNLMNVWISPEPSLIGFRDTALASLRERQSDTLAVHWSMISAVYPFWFQVARQAGRLLALQDQVTLSQITHRLKEHYGDRETISRYTRFVIRSFVAWGVLCDTTSKGCYCKGKTTRLSDNATVALLFEAALHTAHAEKFTLHTLLNNPGFFPFELPMLTATQVLQRTERIDMLRSGLDENLVFLVLK